MVEVTTRTIMKYFKEALKDQTGVNFWEVLKKYQTALDEWAALIKVEKRKIGEKEQNVYSFIEDSKGNDNWGIERGINLLESFRQFLSDEEIIYFVADVDDLKKLKTPTETSEKYSFRIKHEKLLKGEKGHQVNDSLDIKYCINNLKNYKKNSKELEEMNALWKAIDNFSAILNEQWDTKGTFLTYFRPSEMSYKDWKDFIRPNIEKINATVSQTVGQRWEWWFNREKDYNFILKIAKNEETENKKYTIEDNGTSFQLSANKLEEGDAEIQKYLSQKTSINIKLHCLETLKQIQGNKGHELEAFLHGASSIYNEESLKNFDLIKNIDLICSNAKGNLKYYKGADVTFNYSENKPKILLQVKNLQGSISLGTTYTAVINLSKKIKEIFSNREKNKLLSNKEEKSIEDFTEKIVKKFFNIDNLSEDIKKFFEEVKK